MSAGDLAPSKWARENEKESGSRKIRSLFGFSNQSASALFCALALFALLVVRRFAQAITPADKLAEFELFRKLRKQILNLKDQKISLLFKLSDSLLPLFFRHLVGGFVIFCIYFYYCALFWHIGGLSLHQQKEQLILRVMNTDITISNLSSMFSSEDSFKAFMDMANEMELELMDVVLA